MMLELSDTTGIIVDEIRGVATPEYGRVFFCLPLNNHLACWQKPAMVQSRLSELRRSAGRLYHRGLLRYLKGASQMSPYVRRGIPAGIRRRVLDAYQHKCAYCGAYANTVDHVIPWSYVRRHDLSNLVAACNDCNIMVKDKMFKSFDAKRDYILERRQIPKWERRRAARISICSDCGLPFKPRSHGSTLFLCAHCAKLAGLPPEERKKAHRKWMKQVSEYLEDEADLLAKQEAYLVGARS